MAVQTQDIVGLVEAIVRPLVDCKDSVEIVAREDAEDSILVEISVHEDDTGKVIGRQGRIIKAIRTLARAAASRSGVQVDVELID